MKEQILKRLLEEKSITFDELMILMGDAKVVYLSPPVSVPINVQPTIPAYNPYIYPNYPIVMY